MIVVDANVVVYLFLQSPATERCEALLERDGEWFAPHLVFSEVRQALLGHVLHQGLDPLHAFAVLDRVRTLFAGRLVAPESSSVLRLAIASGRSAYDCEYVALAESLGVPLVTGDRRLAASFPERTILLDSLS